MPDELDQLSREDLAAEVRRLRAEPSQAVHELQVHQSELEAQNHQLREAQAQLEESRARYAELFDSAPVGYCTLDAAGYVTSVNATGTVLLGATRERLMFRHFATVLGLKERRAFKEHLDSARSGRATAEIMVPRPDGTTAVLQLISERYRVAGSPESGYRTAFIDVSRAKELEDRLRQLARAGELLASPLDPPAMLSAIVRLLVPAFADLCIVDVRDSGPAARRVEVVFADPRKQASLAERLRKQGERPGWQTPQSQVIASGAPMLLEATSPELDGAGELLREAGLVSMIIAPLTARERILGALTLVSAESGRRYGQSDLVLAQDLARRAGMALDNVMLSERARIAVADRDSLLAAVSHDLRNPLSVIFLKLAVLAKGAPKEDRREGRRSLATIGTAAQTMNRLVGNLLDVATIDAKKLTVRKEKHPLAAIVDEALELARPLAAAKNQRLEAPRLEASLDVDGDRERILQVFANLLGNAVKYCPEGATLSVRVEVSGHFARVQIADDGPGIAPEQLAHVFDRFWRLERHTRGGSGLGLSIVKGIVEAHGGRVWAESQPGAGSRFFFTLPLATASQRTVLVVDDDPELRDTLCEALRQEGYHVSAAANGAVALEALRRSPHSVVLLDLTMPVMDGWAFLDERERDPQLRATPVVVVSGRSEDAPRLAAMNAGWLPKPVHIDELLQRLEQPVAA